MACWFVVFAYQAGSEDDMRRLMYDLDPDSDEQGPMYFVSVAGSPVLFSVFFFL